MSRLTYWLMRDWDEYVDLVRTAAGDAGTALPQVMVDVARSNYLGVTSGEGELPREAEEPLGATPGAVLLRGDDKRLPVPIWDLALLMRTLAWTSWPVVLVTAD